MTKSLLLVDDNDQMRGLLRLLVEDLAETIYECRDGAEAVTVYAAERPSWVLMDIQMGEMDGLTATRRITGQFPAALKLGLARRSSRKGAGRPTGGSCGEGEEPRTWASALRRNGS